MQTHKQALKRSAIEYCQRGLGVIPLRPFSKEALINWQHWQGEIASVDQVDQWWQLYPLANIAIVTGKVNNLTVVDVDGDRGVQSLTALGVGRTPTVKSGSGYHLYCQFADIPSSVNKERGIDIRSTGGYIVAPPSVHPSGSIYKWINERGLDVAMISVPHWLTRAATPRAATPRAVTNHDRYFDVALRDECNKVRSRVEYRNNQLFQSALKIGSHLAKGRGNEDAAKHELFIAAADCGLTDIEARRTIESGIRTAKANPC